MIKQNQTISKPFLTEDTQLKHNDHLKINAKCKCLICENTKEKQNPQLFIDHKYQMLKTEKSKMLSQESVQSSLQKSLSTNQKRIQSFSWYLKKLAFESKSLPQFGIMDTFIMQKGQLLFYIYFESNRCKIIFNSLNCQQNPLLINSKSVPYPLNQVKHKLLERKAFLDIQYQKALYKEHHPNFQWAQLDHESEKQIKLFQKKVTFIDQMLNRVAVTQQKEKQSQFYKMTHSQEYRFKQSILTASQLQEEQKVLTKYEFSNLFDKTRVKVCELTDLDYIQLFPIMYGEEQHSYVKQIKYFKKQQSNKQLFKEAESYVLAWLQKNQSLQKLEQQFISNYFYAFCNLKYIKGCQNPAFQRLTSEKEEQYLMYQSYKLLLHFQAQTNIQIEQCLLEFITQNEGLSFYLKGIKYIKYSNKPSVEVKENKLPNYKHIDKEDYIHDLKGEMKHNFEKFEHQFDRLNNDWENFQNKWLQDRRESDRIFKTVRGYPLTSSLEQSSERIDLHKILKSTNQRYKQQMLGLNNIGKKGGLVNSKIESKVSKIRKGGSKKDQKIKLQQGGDLFFS